MENIIRYGLPIFIWAMIIFFFSSQPYEQQDITPWLYHIAENPWIIAVLSKISFTYGGLVISLEAISAAHMMEFFIRKAAHFCIFFVLGLLTCRAFINSLQSKRKGIMLTFLFVLLYAGLDELHQQFTEGRTPMFSDVIVDTVGGCVGIISYYLFYRSKRG